MATFTPASPLRGPVPRPGGALAGTPVKQDRHIVVVLALAGAALASYEVNLCRR